jgi:uncharacterized protein
MSNSIHIDYAYSTEVRDGTILRADIYRPADNGKHPAIIFRTPYERHSVLSWCFLPVIEAALSGYAIVIQNLRGTWDSEGKSGLGDTSLTIESKDGYDSIEWIASQNWCDGNVGSAGGSYMGLLQWITARENPPHLKAISPWVSGSGGTEPSRNNGIVNLGVALNWILGRAVEIADRQEKQGKDVSQIRSLLDRAVEDPSLIYNYLPLKEVPHFNFEGLKEIWTSRILNTDADTPEYFEKNRTQYEKIQVPCFHVSGWYDFYPSGTLGHFMNMREKGGSAYARQNQHILMGPWLHLGPTFEGNTGNLFFGKLASIEGSQLGRYIISYFDKYLQGKSVDLPHVRYFVMGRNEWRTADTWPVPGTQWHRYYLHSRGHANSSAGDGALSRDEPASELPDYFVYNPHFPLPTMGCRGHWQLTTFAPSPQDQTELEKRQDILCYSTPELKEDIEITGPLKLHLFAASSARDTDFTAKLVDVYPDGKAYNVVCDGIIRARYRNSLFKPELLNPGEVNEYIINLEAVSQLFRKGHRIRLDVSSSSFPEYDRNMNTGHPVGDDAKGIPALQSIFHDSVYASYIDLPVIENK